MNEQAAGPICVASQMLIDALKSELGELGAAIVDIDDQLYEFELCLDNASVALSELGLIHVDVEEELSLADLITQLEKAGYMDPAVGKALESLYKAMSSVFYDETDADVCSERDDFVELLERFVERLQEAED